MSAVMRDLEELALLSGVETEYVNTFGNVVRASAPALEAVLRARSALLPGEKPLAAIERLREERRHRWLAPVLVARAGESRIDLPFGDGAAPEWILSAESGEVLATGNGSGSFGLIKPLPTGYHCLDAWRGGEKCEALVLAAPARAWRSEERTSRRWAAFAPLYAIHDDLDWGVGDFGVARRLIDVLSKAGASAFATLPLLSAYLDELFDPSPYAPVSRLFWNELFLELDPPDSSDAPAVEALRRSEFLDYQGVAREKRRALEARADAFFDSASQSDRADYEAFAANSLLQRYSAFRALTEQRRSSWREWKDVPRGGEIPAALLEPRRVRYHSWVQWLAARQVEALADYGRSRNCTLFLDFPLGSNADGFDVWNEPQLYRDDIVIGAPPDLSYPQGQNWGFRPLDPDAMRRDRFRHWSACLRQQLQHAGMLRLDHVMSLHRLYWIPEGFAPGDGVYVRYPAHELFAVLAIESHRNRAEIIGEDLGTVPDIIRTLMREHAVDGMYVLQRMLVHHPDSDPPVPLATQVASVNNHDLPPFASFCAATDLEEKVRLGVIPVTRQAAELEKRGRGLSTLRRWLGAETPRSLWRRATAFLLDSPASLVIISLEDLWGELFAQNIPTTSSERANWRHKIRLSVDEIARLELPLGAEVED
jgi:4-alpha-glucanotransferase